MKKIIAALLVVALVTPSFAFAVDEILPTSAPRPGTGSTQDVLSSTGPNASAGIANLAASGEVVGCQSASFGGALAQTLGAALQQAATGFIRSSLQGAFSKLAAKAGPFGGFINAIGNIAINKLSTFVQNKIAQAVGGLAGGTVGQALGVVTGIGPGAGLGPSVPVDPITVKQNIINTDAQTLASQKANELREERGCVLNPLVAKLRNALLSMITRSIIDFANNGLDGNSAMIDLPQFAKTALGALIEDFAQNATANICSKDRGSTQALILTQYQYEESYAVRSQCTDEQATDDDGDSEQLYNRVFQDQNTQIGAYIHAESAFRSEKANLALTNVLTYIAGSGVKPTIKCEKGDDPNGILCKGGLGAEHTVLTGDQAGHIIKKAITTPVDQLLNADEIGELVDAFTAGLTQFVFQGIDGLAGASKKSSNNASYLDSMVNSSTGGAVSGTQQVIGGDIAAAAEVEAEYLDTVSTALTGIQQIKTTYTSAIACYQPKVNTSNSAIALQRIQNASTTISTILNPQIATLTAMKQKSQAAVNEYEALLARVESAEVQNEILEIHAEFTALISSGRVHSTAELTALQNDLQAAAPSLSILTTDSAAQLTECQAL